jgi:predicted acylesterase/phospholipase RssA
MRPFRKNVAFAFDGGGLRGIITARALTMVEEALGQPLHDVVGLTTGTSTGSILAAALATGLSAKQILELYVSLGPEIFKKNLRSTLWPLMTYRYPRQPLQQALEKHLGNLRMGDLWQREKPKDLVITTFDLVENHTRFIKPWKLDYKEWRVVDAVLASAAAPTYFPVVNGRYTDGGVGSYNNPCYLAAYEIQFCLGWKLEETTLISLGTGRAMENIKPGEAEHFRPLQWLPSLIDAFGRSADDQQVHLVETFFKGLDFRRFQVNMPQAIPLDDPSQTEAMLAYGEQLGKMILNDQLDSSMGIRPTHAFPRAVKSKRPKQ